MILLLTNINTLPDPINNCCLFAAGPVPGKLGNGPTSTDLLRSQISGGLLLVGVCVVYTNPAFQSVCLFFLDT